MMSIKDLFAFYLNDIGPVLLHIKRVKENVGAIHELPLRRQKNK